MDPTKQTIYECIQSAFRAAGLNEITSPEQIISWAAIPDVVKMQIGNAIRGCVNRKLSKDPGDVVGVILVASQQEPAMLVKNLVEIVFQLVQQA